MVPPFIQIYTYFISPSSPLFIIQLAKLVDLSFKIYLWCIHFCLSLPPITLAKRLLFSYLLTSLLASLWLYTPVFAQNLERPLKWKSDHVTWASKALPWLCIMLRIHELKALWGQWSSTSYYYFPHPLFCSPDISDWFLFWSLCASCSLCPE